MRSLSYLALALLAAPIVACTETTPTPTATASVRLVRATDGSIKVELDGVAVPVRAVEVELLATGGPGGAVLLEDAVAPPGVPLDVVRVAMRGINRAVLFAGDTRGVRLAGSGEVARVRARLVSGGAAQGSLSIARAVVAGVDGAAIEVALGGPLPLQ